MSYFRKFRRHQILRGILRNLTEQSTTKNFLVKEHNLNISAHEKLLKSVEGARRTVPKFFLQKKKTWTCDTEELLF